jgi:phage terminase large subunit-like protein
VLATVVALIVMAINPLLGLIALVAVFVIAEIIARTVQIKALRRRLRETS